jgi:hypothetical protein
MLKEIIDELKLNFKKYYNKKILIYLILNIIILFLSLLLFYFKSFFNINFIFYLYLLFFYIFLLDYTAYITSFIEKSEYDNIDLNTVLSNLNKSIEISVGIIVKYIPLAVAFYLIYYVLQSLKIDILEKSFYSVFSISFNFFKSKDYLYFIYLLSFLLILIIYPFYSNFLVFIPFYIIDKNEIFKNGFNFSFNIVYKKFFKIFGLNIIFYLIIFITIFLGLFLINIFYKITVILVFLQFLLSSIIIVLVISVKTYINFYLYRVFINTNY